MSAIVIDFVQERLRRRMLENEQHFRELAKRIVAAYHLHGEEGYHNAFFSACRGDNQMRDMLVEYVQAEIKRGANR